MFIAKGKKGKKGKISLDFRIRKDMLDKWLGLERQKLLENIRKLSLVEDPHGYYVENVDSLLRNLPPDDKSVYDMVRALLIGCIFPYLLEKRIK